MCCQLHHSPVFLERREYIPFAPPRQAKSCIFCEKSQKNPCKYPLFCARSPGELRFIVIGARDFSPEITVHLIGTSVFALQAAPRQESPVLRQSSSPANGQIEIIAAPAVAFKMAGRRPAELLQLSIVTRQLSILLNSQLRQRHKKAPEIALRGSFVIRCGGSGRTRIFYFVIRNSYFVPVIAQFHQKLMR